MASVPEKDIRTKSSTRNVDFVNVVDDAHRAATSRADLAGRPLTTLRSVRQVPRYGMMLLDHYADRLPVTDTTPRITLGEGGTPLIACRRLADEIGLASLYAKFEGLNPTGSFKDRGMVLAVAKAMEEGKDTLICASTGNTSASAAAYAAHAGLRTLIVIPSGRIAGGKLVQAQVFGAKIVAIAGNFDQALEAVREIADRYPVAVVNSINPFRIEGQKTAAFEIVDELGHAPDVLAIPVGNAGNITAYWKGFGEYATAGKCRLPKMVGGQAAGAAPIVEGRIVSNPETVATAIRIGNPASWRQAVAAQEESGGIIASVSDEAILQAQRDLATKEGIFCEPASAASLAVLRRMREEGKIEAGVEAVCVLTGNGLKDVDAVAGWVTPPLEAEPNAASIALEAGLE